MSEGQGAGMLTATVKWCKSCGEHKTLTEFYSNSRGYHSSQCKPCDRLKSKKYKQLHGDTPGSQRKSYYKRVHGVNALTMDMLIEMVGNKCHLCQRTPDGTVGDVFVLDHDHESGKYRGILCTRCNLALGYFKDNIKVMKRAITYLESGGMFNV